jgi:hypothetical protein
MQAALSQAVYSGAEGVRNLAELHGGRYNYRQSGSTSLGMLIFPDHVHVSVAGTNDRYDWAINRNRKLESFNLLDIHAGYLDASGWLANELLRSGDTYNIGRRRVYLGGHSAGGAIAEILALRLYGTMKVSQTYTFGSPKWCSRLTASLYSSLPFESFRFVMAGDPVPYLPLNSWRELLGRPGFAHTSLGIEISDSGQMLSENGLTRARRLYCAARHVWRYGVINSLIALRRLDEIIVESHGITRYRAAIEQALERSQ